MTTFFTSDHHFGHENVISHASRPFANVDEMDAEMIRRWNAVVGKHDHVWHLGDFCWRGKPDQYLNELNGHVHLIYGNHDARSVRKSDRWASSQPYAEIKVDETNLILFHYSMRVWSRCHHGSIHLYGHSHGNLPGDAQSCDVGVDCWDFRPVSLTLIKARLAESPPRQPVDHHGVTPESP